MVGRQIGKRVKRALFVALAVAVCSVATAPFAATASTSGGGGGSAGAGFNPTRLDLKRNHLRQVLQQPVTPRASAPLTGVACSPLFSTVATTNRTTFNELEAASATSPTDIWAAGLTNTNPASAVDHSMIAHYNGSSWGTTPLTNIGNGDNDLVAIYAADPNDVWSVGDYRNSGAFYNLGWHWNGSTWTRITMPQPSSIAVQELAGISGTGSKDIWAVGVYGPGGGVASTLALHWNGSTWTKVTTPNAAGNAINVLENVYATAPNDVWAVGFSQVDNTSFGQTLIEHWDGSSWSVVTSANVNSDDNVLFNVSATASGDAWAVGYSDTGSGTPLTTLIEHYNGSAWSVVASTDNGTGDNELLAVDAVSTSNAWAIGFGSPSGGAAAQTLVEHWDGASWTTQTSDNPATGDNLLVGGTALPGSLVYAVGGAVDGTNTSESAIVQQFSLPAPTGVTAVAGDGQAAVSWTAPSCDGGFAITQYLVTAHDGCTVEGNEVLASGGNYVGLTDDSPVYFTVQAESVSLGAETPSAPSAFVIPTGTPPAAVSACSLQQYHLTSPSSANFTDIDATNLALSTTTAAAAQTALITGNVDLWTATAGLNQDVGLFVSGGAFGTGQVVAWKESGGFAGTFSPNAAAVQAVIPLDASTAYTFKLQWKGNKPSTGTIYAGAGPLPGGSPGFSPTRLSVRIVPTASNALAATVSTKQYTLTGSNGATWQDIDGTGLSSTFAVGAPMTAVITANADLFTANTGFNQDIAINVDGTVVAWKESGGFAGTFSPNAAFVSVMVPLTAATHTVKLQWKTNKPEGAAHIYAGAGPWPAGGSVFSPTSFAVQLFTPDPNVTTASSTQQYTLHSSDGGGWTAMDTTNLQLSGFSPGTITPYTFEMSANVDLFTGNAGFNQDVGIFISGGAFGTGTLVAWKESGGFAGTFSPNAAYVDAVVHLQSGTTYSIWIAWKTNKPGGASTIYAAAGGSAPFSPTRLNTIELSSP